MSHTRPLPQHDTAMVYWCWARLGADGAATYPTCLAQGHCWALPSCGAGQGRLGV